MNVRSKEKVVIIKASPRIMQRTLRENLKLFRDF